MKKLSVLFRGLIIIIIFGLFSSCGNDQEKKVWDESTTSNTMESYEGYLNQFPEGKHIKEANDKIEEFYFKKAEVSENPIAIFHEYQQKYPQGTYNPMFETIIYNFAILKNDISYFEEYATLFPEGKYLGEFETLIYNNILNGESTLGFYDYLERFPESKYKAEVDSILFDSILIKMNFSAITQYNNVFPDNNHKTELDSLQEVITYNNLIQTNNVRDFTYFINTYPESKMIATIDINSTPVNASVLIADNKDQEFKSVNLPATVQAIKGTEIVLTFSAPKYHDLIYNYTVNDDSVQIISQTLESSSEYIYIDEFDNPTSLWTGSSSDYEFVLDNNGHLVCMTKEKQLQVLKTIPINFKDNFKIEIRFSISSIIPQYLSYYGIVWGDEYQLKYFFISHDGHRNIGSQENDLRSPSNENGYSRWITSSSEISNWPQTTTFKEGGYNIIIMENKNKTLSYSINGQTVFQENFNAPRDNFLGFGLGNANVIVDYIKISK